jgi:glutamine synthetase type III
LIEGVDKMESKDREICSYPKHTMPTKQSFQKDLCNWWIGYACREENYENVNDVINAATRLSDYVIDDPEDGYGFTKELTPESRYEIIYEVLRKIINSLIEIERNK